MMFGFAAYSEWTVGEEVWEEEANEQQEKENKEKHASRFHNQYINMCGQIASLMALDTLFIANRVKKKNLSPIYIFLRLNTTMFALFVQCLFIYGWTRIEFLL